MTASISVSRSCQYRKLLKIKYWCLIKHFHSHRSSLINWSVLMQCRAWSRFSIGIFIFAHFIFFLVLFFDYFSSSLKWASPPILVISTFLVLITCVWSGYVLSIITKDRIFMQLTPEKRAIKILLRAKLIIFGY